MTELLDRAMKAASELAPEKQDEIARFVLKLVDDEDDVYVLTPEEEADIDEGLAEAERGEIATEAQVRGMWAKYGL